MEKRAGAVAMPRPKACGDQDDEGCEQHAEEGDRGLADGFGAAEIPEHAADDDGEFPEDAKAAGGPCGSEAAKVEDEDGRIDGHVEDAGGDRQPTFLKAPEAAEGAANPDVEAAFGWDGAGQFADHERSGEAPDEGNDGEKDKRASVTCFADDVFEAIGAAGDHEVGGGEERDEAQLVAGRESAVPGQGSGRVGREVDGGDLLEGRGAVLLAMYR